MQPSWYSFSSWPHSDITSLGRSVTLHFLGLAFFYSTAVFEIGYDIHGVLVQMDVKPN